MSIKLDYNPFDQQDQINLHRIAKALLLTLRGEEMDGIQAMNVIAKKYGLRIDHHVFTDAMDGMTRTNQAVCTQPYGYTKYRIIGA